MSDSLCFFDRVCCSEAMSQNKSNIHACLWVTNSSLWLSNHRQFEGFELGILIGAGKELESRQIGLEIGACKELEWRM